MWILGKTIRRSNPSGCIPPENEVLGKEISVHHLRAGQRTIFTGGVTNLILMRHADIDFRVFHSDLDAIPLTNDGLKRVTNLAKSKNFKGYDLVYSSPARRALDTAKVFSAKIGKEPIVKPCLNERVTLPYWTDPNNWNRLEATTWSDFTMALEGGESLDEARKRIVSCVNEIVSVSLGKTVLIVSHATVLCLLLSSLAGKVPSRIMREQIGFASFALASYEDGKFHVDSWFRQ